jgi:hypothetical protein
MWGIVGSYSKSPISDEEQLIKMRETVTHRGPDDAGLWWSQDKCLGLAQHRLAIIELERSFINHPRSAEYRRARKKQCPINYLIKDKDNMGWSDWEEFRRLTPNDKTNLQEQE